MRSLFILRNASSDGQSLASVGRVGGLLSRSPAEDQTYFKVRPRRGRNGGPARSSQAPKPVSWLSDPPRLRQAAQSGPKDVFSNLMDPAPSPPPLYYSAVCSLQDLLPQKKRGGEGPEPRDRLTSTSGSKEASSRSRNKFAPWRRSGGSHLVLPGVEKVI